MQGLQAVSSGRRLSERGRHRSVLEYQGSMLVPKPEMPDKQFRLPWFLTALTATRYVSAVWHEFGRFMLQSPPGHFQRFRHTFVMCRE